MKKTLLAAAALASLLIPAATEAALLRIWLGPNPAERTLKDALLGAK